ncbi:class I SAM-dependent methyltransferase [Lacibacter sediminis]|uniref:Class I SAM-dependent methyltransferase n=1 Tax=Lacibacter sediminis TaxID=2760713 RepID=A0A7G5XGB2_9BACT|nr:class I SAM-dependent methyltransferase [Lacibacter sediminis]QNA44515.1 class I SAM-dependent methyltransferase [Lacibacter sediminis]
MQQLKKIYNALVRPAKLALLDYAVQPVPVYNKQQPHDLLYKQIAANNNGYTQLLKTALQYQQQFNAIPMNEVTDNKVASWKNGFFPGLDMIMLYTLLTQLKPKRYVEIGSGTSTKLAAKAKNEQQLSFSITCIDPSPRKEITAVADEWLNMPLQQVPLSLFENLDTNDVLFFDGSHLLHANSDVQWFFMEVMPRLKQGVVVQIHDIYLPYDYPQNICDRFYAEQYMLATMLLSNPDRYEIISPNFYLSEDDELKQILEPLWKELPGVEKHGGSFWFKIN